MEQSTEMILDDTGRDRGASSVATAVLQASTVEEVSIEEEVTFHESTVLFRFLKRLIDIVFSLLGIILLAPVFLIAAVSIKLYDVGYIFHFREIVGLQTRRFSALKFRTMIPDADGYLVNHPKLLQE